MDLQEYKNMECSCKTCSASLVKYCNPGHIVLDLYGIVDCNYSDEARKLVKLLTVYWQRHEADPVDGRKFFLGETVAVKVGNVWRPGMIVDFKLIEAAHYYDVVLLDCGRIIEVCRMEFREIPVMPNLVNLPSRYVFFILANVLPIDMKGRLGDSCDVWSGTAINGLETLFLSASAIKVVANATQSVGENYVNHKVFGNILLQVGNHVVDVKYRLLRNNLVFNDPDRFRRYHHLSTNDIFENICSVCKDEFQGLKFTTERTLVHQDNIPDNYVDSEKDISGLDRHMQTDSNTHQDCFTSTEPEEVITDQNLDQFLHKAWQRDGYDPINQNSRDKIRQMLMGEQRLQFQLPGSQERKTIVNQREDGTRSKKYFSQGKVTGCSKPSLATNNRRTFELRREKEVTQYEQEEGTSDRNIERCQLNKQPVDMNKSSNDNSEQLQLSGDSGGDYESESEVKQFNSTAEQEFQYEEETTDDSGHGREYKSPQTMKLFQVAPLHNYIQPTQRREDSSSSSLSDEMQLTTENGNVSSDSPPFTSPEKVSIVEGIKKILANTNWEVEMQSHIPPKTNLQGNQSEEKKHVDNTVCHSIRAQALSKIEGLFRQLEMKDKKLK